MQHVTEKDVKWNSEECDGITLIVYSEKNAEFVYKCWTLIS